MKKVKVMKFQVSDYGYMKSNANKWVLENQNVCSENYITDSINNFISDNNFKLIDIKCNIVEVSFHNNGGSNKIEAHYIIIYNDEDNA